MSRSQPCGFISLLYSIGDKPLKLWSKHVSLDGRIRRVQDELLNDDKVLEIMGPHHTPVPTNISCPANPSDVLNIKLPILVLIIKNLELTFKIELQIIDKMQHRRKFMLATHLPEKLSTTNASCLPLKLDEGWNNLELNFQTICPVVYGSEFHAFQRIIIYPNCRLRRVYFQDRHYKHDETPIELCQAFFDMYMLKWGIHLVERSCQTEEIYTGALEPCDFEFLTTESDISVIVGYCDTHLKDNFFAEQITRTVGTSMSVSSTIRNDRSVQFNHSSEFTNQLDEKINEIPSFRSKSSNNEDSLQILNCNRSSMRGVSQSTPEKIKCEDVKRNDDQRFIKNHPRKMSKEKPCERQDKCEILKEREDLAVSSECKKSSEYLDMHFVGNVLNSSMKNEGTAMENQINNYDKNRKRKRKVKKKSEYNKNLKMEATNTKRILDSHAMSSPYSFAESRVRADCQELDEQNHITNLKAPIDLNMTKATSEKNSSGSEKGENNQNSKNQGGKTIQEIISEVRKIREQLKNRETTGVNYIDSRQDTVKDLEKAIPPVVEMQAKPSDITSKKIILSTDQAIGDFLEFRHAVNQKILEKLHDKGFSLAEVELSIYNSKNRRNCYGQGKLIESQKSHSNKGSGFASAKPLAMDASLKKRQLQINNEICMQLRKELDATLLKLKTTHVCMTPQMIDETIGNIVRNFSRISNVDLFTARQAAYKKEKVYHTRDMADQNTKIPPSPKNPEDTTNLINRIIKDLGQFSEEQTVDVLYQR